MLGVISVMLPFHAIYIVTGTARTVMLYVLILHADSGLMDAAISLSTVNSTKNTTSMHSTELAGSSVLLQRQQNSEKHSFPNTFLNTDHDMQPILTNSRISTARYCMSLPSFMRLSSSSLVGSLPLIKNALHSPTSRFGFSLAYLSMSPCLILLALMV